MKNKTIEELLSWAFVHELTKGGGAVGLESGNSAWATIIGLGTRIDTFRKPGEPVGMVIEQGEPHDDAVAVGRAVAELANCEVMIPEGWNALADWPDTDGLADAVVARAVEQYRLRPFHHRAEMLVATIIGQAILGKEMDWAADPSPIRMVERGGKPAWFVRRTIAGELGASYVAEVDGFNPRTKRPQPDAYRKYELSRDPLGDILGRLSYQAWVACLRHLGVVLSGKLSAHRVAPCDRSMTPWLEREGRGVALVVVRDTIPSKKVAAAC